MEKVTRWLTNTQVKIKSEVGGNFQVFVRHVCARFRLDPDIAVESAVQRLSASIGPLGLTPR